VPSTGSATEIGVGARRFTNVCSEREVQQMSKRVPDLLVRALQAASVKNRSGIVRDTLNRIAHTTIAANRARLGA
jgi:TATA-binding protein-associated factor Taf7